MKNTMFKRVFSICLVSAVLASTGSAVFSAQAIEEENTTASAAVSSEENTADTDSETAAETAPGAGDSDFDEEAYLEWEREHFKDYGLGAIIDEDEEIDPEHVVDSVEEYNEYAGIDNGKNGAAALPDAVDNTTNENARFFPPIGSQGSIGSCAAWSTTYYQYTYMRNKARNVTTTEANTFSPTWTYNLYSCGDTAGANADMIYKIISSIGAATIQDVPIKHYIYSSSDYLNWYATDDIWARATENRLSGYTDLASVNDGTPITSAKDSDLDVYKTALNNGEILTYTTYFRTWDVKRIKTSSASGVDNSFVGEYATTTSERTSSAHQMTLVGYNDNIWIDINDNDKIDTGEMGAFKVANSHGADWRNNGFCWVAYDALNTVSAVPGVENASGRKCIFFAIESITVENKNYSSGMLLKCVFNSSCMYEASVKATAQNKTTGETKSFLFHPNKNALEWYVKDNSSRDIYFNYAGEKGDCDGTLYFDLNNVISNLNSSNIHNYTWTIEFNDKLDNDSKLIMKECKIIDRAANNEMPYFYNCELPLNGNTKTVSKNDLNSSFVVTAKLTPGGNIGLYEMMDLQVTCSGAVFPIEHIREKYRNGELLYSQTSHTDYNMIGFISGDGGNYGQTGDMLRKSICVDATGAVFTDTQTFSVKETKLNDLVADKPRCHPGETVVFTPKTSCLNTNITSSCFKYTVTKDGVSQQYNAESDNKLNWTPSETGSYTIKCDIVYNSKTVATKTISYHVGNILSGVSLDIYAGDGTSGDEIGVFENIYQDHKFQAGVAPFTIECEYIKDGKTIISDSFTESSSDNLLIYWKPSEPGVYTFKRMVIDATGDFITKSKTYTVNQTKITSLTPDKTSCYPGEWVTVTPTTEYLASCVDPICFKYTVTKNGVSQQYYDIYNENNKLTWTPTEPGDYTIKCDIVYKPPFDVERTLASKTINYTVKNAQITALTPDKSTCYQNETVNITPATTYLPSGVTPSCFKYTITKNGSSWYFRGTTGNKLNWTPTEAGEYTIKCDIVYNSKTLATKTISYTVKAISLTSLTPDKTSCYPNETVTITPTVNYNASYLTPSRFKYTITKNGSSQQFTGTTGNKLVWTPTEAGEYTIKCDIIYDSKTLATKTITYTVDEAPSDDVTIYYNGFDHPNIHYRVAGGSWTNVPGVAMEQSNEVIGFPYKYTIALNGAANAEVCFNDGNNNWDSRNGQNYTFTKGYYTVQNGTITEFEKPGLAVSLELADPEFPIHSVPTHFTASAINGTAPYTYTFKSEHNGTTITLSDNSSSNFCDFTTMEAGSYTITVTVKDAKGKMATALKTLTAHEPKVTALNTSVEKAYIGQRVDLSMNVNDDFAGTTHLFTVKKNYSINIINAGANTTASWTPSEAGTYTITAGVYYNGNVLSSVSKTFVVEEAPKNEVTIYYNGYATPNIHYQVGNGSWTNVPGVAMTPNNEIAGYTHKYTIDLGDADYANVCFNDGHNNWDSRNGANYRFTKGTYKFSNGTITAM